MVPKNLAVAGPDRAVLLLRAAAGLGRPRRPAGDRALNWIANHALRLVGVEPKDEVASAFTAQEVQSIVERSQAEGLLDDEQGLLAGALEFSRPDRGRRHDRPRRAGDRRPRQHARGRRAAGRPDRVQPVPGASDDARGADRVPAPEGRPVRRRRAPRRAGAAVAGARAGRRGGRRRGRGRAGGHAAARARTWRGSTRRGGPSASCSSRTSSRSSWARCATRCSGPGGAEARGGAGQSRRTSNAS